MTEVIESTKTELPDPETDGHEANIPVEHIHFNVIDMLKRAASDFEKKTGKKAKFFYAPEALMFLLDGAVRTRARESGNPVPRGSVVANIHDLELVAVRGTCITVTEQPLHDNMGPAASEKVN